MSECNAVMQIWFQSFPWKSACRYASWEGRRYALHGGGRSTTQRRRKSKGSEFGNFSFEDWTPYRRETFGASSLSSASGGPKKCHFQEVALEKCGLEFRSATDPCRFFVTDVTTNTQTCVRQMELHIRYLGCLIGHCCIHALFKLWPIRNGES